jgi:rhomboid protease GluP
MNEVGQTQETHLSAEETTNSYEVRFTPRGFLSALNPSPRTKWRWRGAGSITFEGDSLTLVGKRHRTLLRDKKQEIRAERSQVVDVKVNGSTVTGIVNLPSGAKELLTLIANTPAEALAIASRLPSNRSQSSLDHEAFALALEKLGYRVHVTPVIAAANVVVFLAMVISGINAVHPSGPEMIPWGTNYGVSTLHGQWWRLFTSMFLHFGFVHLLFNMIALLSMGPLVERLLGSARFAALYVFAGLCGSLASLLWNPFVNSAGASGAIFGVLGALLAVMVNPRSQIPATVSVAQRNSALGFVAYNLANGFLHAGIDNACHLGGLVAGFAMGWMLARPLESGEAERNDTSLLNIALGGCLVIAALAWILLHPGDATLAKRQFRETWIKVAKEETEVSAAEKFLREMRDSHAISGQVWATRTLQDIVPQWQAAGDRIAELELEKAPQLEPARAATLDYLRKRRLFAELSAEATRDHDVSKQTWATQVGASIDAQETLTRKLIDDAF